MSSDPFVQAVRWAKRAFRWIEHTHTWVWLAGLFTGPSTITSLLFSIATGTWAFFRGSDGPYAFAIALFVMVTVLAGFRLWRGSPASSEPGKGRGPFPNTGSSFIDESKPDWPIQELAFHLDPPLRTGPSDPVQTFGEIKNAFKTGKLKCWGKEAIYAHIEFTKIDPEYWESAELKWDCILESTDQNCSHAEALHGLDAPRYWALHVNKEQALGIWPEVHPEFYSIHYVIGYVQGRIIADSDSDFPAARREIRQAAADGKITIHGRQHVAAGGFSALFTKIPSDYWRDHVIDSRAAWDGSAYGAQTCREFSADSSSHHGDHYTDLRIKREEVLKTWSSDNATGSGIYCLQANRACSQ